MAFYLFNITISGAERHLKCKLFIFVGQLVFSLFVFNCVICLFFFSHFHDFIVLFVSGTGFGHFKS